MHPSYEEDFYGWVMASAELLKQKRFNEVDMEHLIEELEDMGGNQEDQLINRLVVLLSHLLKWHYQTTHRSHSWKCTIQEQRKRIARLLRKNPSLKNVLKEALHDAYEYACLTAARETGLKEEAFPAACPYTFEECLDEAFYPE